ncbi:hypothetical protein CTAYLR_003596 [Chrysophaeum taylorii]|uniref:UDP-N-acetylglucosamine diphosphorylase n=1 Tax=Chrysophaeum taylorii TaxID=2483200 RepID=A0AAD7XQJ1_9STRA|nr:hypothetical protein CTAYLR_003596 [Chrysophaeum taylorii]
MEPDSLRDFERKMLGVDIKLVDPDEEGPTSGEEMRKMMVDMGLHPEQPLERRGPIELPERLTKELRQRINKADLDWEDYKDLLPSGLGPLLGLDPAVCADLVKRVAHGQIRIDFHLAKQTHVFRWLDKGKLTIEQACKLAEQLEGVEILEMVDAFAAADRAAKRDDKPEILPLASAASSDDPRAAEWARAGMEAISRGEVAALILAGGQGTRLGFDGPKGLYDVGLPSRKPLFLLFAERLRKIGQLAREAVPIEEEKPTTKVTHSRGTPLPRGFQKQPRPPEKNVKRVPSAPPLLVMTSEINDAPTRRAFEEMGYFGLDARDVLFFSQRTVPSFAEDGNAFMRSGHEMATAPDGNGGVYKALAASGVLDDLEFREIKYVHVFSVDNALCRPCDPVFLGYCKSEKALVASKVVWKASPDEKVGVLATRDGRPGVVEYSELSADLAASRDENGELKFGAGNICNHLLATEFLSCAAATNPDVLPYHLAHKKIDAADPETGAPVPPPKPNAYKLEAFIFDAFKIALDHATIRVPREDDFAPVKNAVGADSPQTARDAILRQGARWLRNAGATVLGDHGVELAPALTYAGEGLASKFDGATVDATQAPAFFDINTPVSSSSSS